MKTNQIKPRLMKMQVAFMIMTMLLLLLTLFKAVEFNMHLSK